VLPKNTRYSRVALGYDADDKIRYVTAFARHSEYNQSAVAAAPREVRVVSTTATAGQTVSVMINVDAMGDESVYGFSLNYDTTKLSNPVVTIGTAGGGVASNPTQPGKIGVSVSFGGGTIAVGNNQTLVKIQFTVAGAASGTTPLTFGDSPTPREVASAPCESPCQVMVLPTTFTNGMVTINAAPTAANVSFSGRVLNGQGKAVAKAQLTMTNSQGEKFYARSNGFGYFKFTEVEAGETYIITVKSKQYRFAAQVVNAGQDVTDLIFIAESEQ